MVYVIYIISSFRGERLLIKNACSCKLLLKMCQRLNQLLFLFNQNFMFMATKMLHFAHHHTKTHHTSLVVLLKEDLDLYLHNMLVTLSSFLNCVRFCTSATSTGVCEVKRL